MARVRRFGVLSSAKLSTAVMGIVGLIAGILYSFGGLIVDALVSIGWVSSVSAETPGLSYGTVLAFGALIGMPIIFAVPGLLVGAIGAFLYNVAARRVGGIEMDFEE